MGWSKTARAQRVAHHLKLLLKDEQGQQSGPWAIKDPRSSLLLPLWRQVAAELDQPLRLLLAFRDPAEVVTSLITRDAEATGMTTARAQALWIRHQQQMLLDADDLPLHVVSYSRWFDAPQAQVEALQRFCQSNRNDSQLSVSTGLHTTGLSPQQKQFTAHKHQSPDQAAPTTRTSCSRFP